MMIKMFLIASGGFFGAIARFLISEEFRKKTKHYPLATMIVNLLGSFLIGVFMSLNASEQMTFLIGLGFLGAFTTFSTFSVNVIQLYKEGRYLITFLFIVINFVGSIGLCLIGYFLGALIE